MLPGYNTLIKSFSEKTHGADTDWIVTCAQLLQSCPTLCDPMDCSLPDSFDYGIIQARILEWVANSFSRGSSQPRDRTQVSYIAGRLFNIWERVTENLSSPRESE